MTAVEDGNPDVIKLTRVSCRKTVKYSILNQAALPLLIVVSLQEQKQQEREQEQEQGPIITGTAESFFEQLSTKDGQQLQHQLMLLVIENKLDDICDRIDSLQRAQAFTIRTVKGMQDQLYRQQQERYR
jgi:hypothetical protein